MYSRKKYTIAYSFNNGTLTELVLRCSGYLSNLLSPSAQLISNTVWETVFSVRRYFLAQTSAMTWTLQSWVLTSILVPSDFANQGGKHWEKISINEIVIECRITVMCLSPGHFMLLPCPFVPDTLPRELKMKTRLRCSQSIKPKISQSMKGAAFQRCYQKLKCIFCSVLGFFHPVSVSMYLWSIWEELLKTQLVVAARRETQHSLKAYSESLFPWWEK